MAAPELVTVTYTGGEKAFQATDILQVVGVIGNMGNTGSAASPALRVTFEDGTVVENSLGIPFAATSQTNNFQSVSNPLIGNTFTGITKLQVVGQPGVVTLKLIQRAEEMVSEPMILPLIVEDDKYAVSLETSVDMLNWAPAAPGDYLGSSSHRFFRVKAVKKAAVVPAAPAAE